MRYNTLRLYWKESTLHVIECEFDTSFFGCYQILTQDDKESDSSTLKDEVVPYSIQFSSKLSQSTIVLPLLVHSVENM